MSMVVSEESYDHARSLQGALYVEDAKTVAEKIIFLRKNVGITRFMLHVPLSVIPHEMSCVQLSY